MFKNIPQIELKMSHEVAGIRRSCRVAEKVLKALREFIRPGISTLELDAIAYDMVLAEGAKPSLKGYKGFPGTICTSVNEVVAHGVPSRYRLQDGDIITVDITVSLDGWHGDSAWTYEVGHCSEEMLQLIRAAWCSTLAGITAVKAGARLGDIGYKVSECARKMGFVVLEDFVGHGIGRRMHEDPLVPHIGKPGLGLKVSPGMVFTIEPMVSSSSGGEMHVLADGWSVVMDERLPVAQFEHTVAVYKDSIEILTFSEKKFIKGIDHPPDIC